MRFAVISDIHGNLRAFEAVLRTVDSLDVDDIYNLGDSIYGPLQPAETADLLIERKIKSVLGNQDRILLPGQEDSGSQSLEFTVAKLEERHFKWLKTLSPVIEINDDITMFHGSPESDMEYLLCKVTADGLGERTEKELSKMLKHIKSRVILCGHDHYPRHVQLSDGRHIINPGSVGCPAFSDDVPYAHAVENESPDASFAVVTMNGSNNEVEFLKVAYDWQSAAEEAEKNGRPDWVDWLQGYDSGEECR